MILLRSWLLVWWCVCSCAAHAQAEHGCDSESIKHFMWENDGVTGKLFSHSDKWYTNGFKLYNGYHPDCVQEYLPDFMQGWIAGFGGGRGAGDPSYAIQVGNVFGQLMFTPKNISSSAPQPMDSFWGGWLYMGVVAQRRPYVQLRASGGMVQEADGVDSDELETLELDVGVTGPPSAAERAQRVIHSLTRSIMPAGWGNQIRTELGIQCNYARIKRVWKYPGYDESPFVDVSWHYGGTAGTLFDYVNGGFTVRMGTKLTDETPNVIESPAIGQFRKADDALYMMARVDMKGVAHNTFIDGSLFRVDPHVSNVSTQHLVPQLTLGGVLGWKYNHGVRTEGARVGLMLHRRGAEFSSPTGREAIFNFATLNIEWDL